mgnify:CR=1 FL=1
MAAAGALLGYVEETQKQRLPHLTSIAVESGDGAIAMNAATRRHLELDTRVDGETRHTLLGVLDSTVSPMGGRLLRRWLHRPLRDREVLRLRHDAVATLVDHRADEALRERFRALGDLERILSRIALRSARPRDLSTLRDGLAMLPALREVLAPLDSPRLRELSEQIGEHAAEAHLLAQALVEQPPVLARDGGVFADGYDAELDELRQLSSSADRFLVELEAREREATGIPTLKVGYNRVHGYFIEISKGQSAKAPAHYTRRQTLTGAERYITEELKQFEDKVLSARERAPALPADPDRTGVGLVDLARVDVSAAGTTVSDNSLSGNVTGIRARGGPTVSRNRVDGGEIGEFGIDADGATSTIEENSVVSTSSAAIAVRGADGTVENNLIGRRVIDGAVVGNDGDGIVVFAEPWNPYLPVLWWLVVVLAVWSVLDGDRWMLVVAVAAGSFCAQTHLPYLGLVGGLGAVAVGGLGLAWWSARSHPARERVWPVLAVAAAVGLALWAAPLIDQVDGVGNLSRVRDSMLHPEGEPVGPLPVAETAVPG